jgi:hypothetical protein
MEDDTILTAFHKSDSPVAQPGDEVEYEVTKQSARGKSGKVRKPGSGQGYQRGGGSRSEVQDQIARQWAINASIQWILGTSGDPSKEGLVQVAAIARLLLEMRDDMDGFIVKMKHVDIRDASDLPF